MRKTEFKIPLRRRSTITHHTCTFWNPSTLQTYIYIPFSFNYTSKLKSRNQNLMIPQDSYILTELRIACLQTGHLGDVSRSTERAHLGQQTRCPQGTNADLRCRNKQMTHNCPSGTSPSATSSAASAAAASLSWMYCRWLCLRCLQSFHLFQFLIWWIMVLLVSLFYVCE